MRVPLRRLLFVQFFGPLVDFLLQVLEQLELGRRGDSIVIAAASTATAAAAATASTATAVTGLVRL